MNTLKGKTILITGAAMGLGFATARACAAEGAHLSLVDYNENILKMTRTELTAQFPQSRIISFVVNVADEQAVKDFVDKTVEVFGRIDGFYNSAGIEGRQAPLATYDMEMFRQVIDINLMGVLLRAPFCHTGDAATAIWPDRQSGIGRRHPWRP